MAELYLTLLTQIVDRLELQQVGDAKLECKHFFSGAALYANGKIFASLSPAGFAVKLPADRRRSLIEEGKGTEFRFFPNGPIKREYVALSEATIADEGSLRDLLALGVDYALGMTDPKTSAGN
jgi:TfoX/Sxy family transcriptional regulator of competence genes